jgi:molecular chaperone IbpA
VWLRVLLRALRSDRSWSKGSLVLCSTPLDGSPSLPASCSVPWPPYNIARVSEDEYRITMALAGFAPDEIELVQHETTLLVAGHKNADEKQGGEVLHRGIATRPFRQTFNLAQHVKVTDARFEHGLLVVELRREVPEALKPRRIEIASGSGQASMPQNNVTTLEGSKVA